MKTLDGRTVIKQGQIDILEALYKYRFGSRSLLAGVLGVNESTLYKKLAVLIKHGLVGGKLDNGAKLQGLPVAYFLTAKGLRFLAALDRHDYVTEKIIKASYRDKSLAQATVTHFLNVFAQVLILKRRYPDLKAYLRRDMYRFSYFPEPQPDAFLSLSVEGVSRRFFLDVVADSYDRKPLFQRVSAHIDFFDKGGWDVTGIPLPTLLYVAESAAVERRVRRMVKSVLLHLEPDVELEVYTTTKKALQSMDAAALVWTALDDDEPATLAHI